MFDHGTEIPPISANQSSELLILRATPFTELKMASTPTKIGPPYTYEEALVVKIQDGLMVDLFPECTEVEPDFWIGRTCHDRFLLPVDGVPSNWCIQLVCSHLVSNDRKKDKSTPTGTISAMLFAIPASVFFGYSCQGK